MDNMTAMVSCFARAYHFRNNREWIFRDDFAGQLLTPDEYTGMANHMTEGISFFCPGFAGTKAEALRYIADNHLSPSVLARSAFCERMLDNAVLLGCRQYILFGAGLDTYSLRSPRPDVTVYELDKPEMIADKTARIRRLNLPETNTRYIPCDLAAPDWTNKLSAAGFDPARPAFGSFLGLTYYLSKAEFSALLAMIGPLWCEGSSLCLDYPVAGDGDSLCTTRPLAAAAGEPMKAAYSFREMEKLLGDHGFLIYEHLDSAGMEAYYFERYNAVNGRRPMHPPKDVCYLLAVKKHAPKNLR